MTRKDEMRRAAREVFSGICEGMIDSLDENIQLGFEVNFLLNGFSINVEIIDEKEE